MPVLHSKSPSSRVTSILEPLHHTCHPWLRHALLPGPVESTRGDFAVIRTNLKFRNRAFSVAGPRAAVLNLWAVGRGPLPGGPRPGLGIEEFFSRESRVIMHEKVSSLSSAVSAFAT